MSSLMYGCFKFIQSCVFCTLFDVIIFICVDQLCKALLANCVSLSEKRDIWLFESLALIGLSFIVYVYDHVPLLLWLLGSVTFVSATLTGRVDVMFYWETLKNYWSEFSDQEESMRGYEEPKVMNEPVYKNQVSEDQNREYLRQTGEINIANENSVNTAHIGEGLKTLKYNEKKAMYELVGQPKARKPKLLKTNPDKDSSVRHRQPSRATDFESIVTSVAPPVSETQSQSMLDNLGSLGTKVWSMFGFPMASSMKVPPGLNNSGRNLCFMNSVLQCIARAPNLADELAEEVKSCRSQDQSRLVLMDALAETLQQINIVPDESSILVIDTNELCRAGSEVNPDLLSNDKHQQMQQDACEFLSWLLYEVHESINDNKGSKCRRNNDEAMAKLEAVYGKISESYISQMKQECRDQIACSRGLSDVEITEPVQNLSNLEWITHKRSNCSVIDNMFTFQCVELRMCSSCNNTTAHVQTMNVLSLPIAKQDQSIDLKQCLSSFIAQERLYGRDGLQCEKCQNAANQALSVPETPGVQTRRSVLKSQSVISATPLSPIQRPADSTVHYQAPNFLASTPLPGASKQRQSAPTLSTAPTTKLITEGLRQCMLRRLSECLTIQLMRFNYDPFTKKVHKIHTPVCIPLHDLDFSAVLYDSVVDREDMTIPSKTHLYSLYAISLHIGGDSTGSGHYLAYCKGANGLWYKFDDDLVRQVKSIEAEFKRAQIKENCYLLFYRKQHTT